MKKFLLTLSTIVVSGVVFGQSITAKWELSDKDNLSAVTVSGEESATSIVSTAFLQGTDIASTATMTGSNAESNYTAVTYDPQFTTFTPSTRQTGKAAGHCIVFSVTPQSGHTFKPTTISFDAAKVGTDGGNLDVYYKVGAGAETALATGESPLRNKIGEKNSTGYSHYEYPMGDIIAEGKAFYIYLYIYNLNGVDNENPKAIGFRNVAITGAVDEKIFEAGDFVESFTFKGTQTYGAEGETIELADLVKGLKNGGLVTYPNRLYGDPSDWSLKLKDGYISDVQYSGHVAVVKIMKDSKQVFYFEVMFSVSNRQPKPAAKPLNRGLIAVHLSAGMGSGNLVSWRARETDDKNVKFKLYRGTSATSQPTAVNTGNFIMGKTNFNDVVGGAASFYRLEVYDGEGNLVETEVSRKTWANQTLQVTLGGDAPVDTKHGALYHPNDASFCDMDGDGEYEIILKWSPSNEKDAAGSGTTSQAVYDCYKMDGTRLWRIQTGYNMFNSAHTTPFIAWDFDGDGYGEFMVKTAPGAIDGEGNYVIMGNDDPYANWKNSNGKQVEGPEYITVFDGTTGAELATIPYHTKYGDVSTNVWGDSKQNRSERYLAAIAWLDGAEGNPSPIFARGYYNGAFICAYDWDGVTLKERWIHRAYAANNGTVTYADGTVKKLTSTVYGEGAHWISIGDVDGDGKQEIMYGAGALKPDGTTHYRTGFEHGDAIHTGDFIPSRPGLEYFMSLEHKPYGAFLCDASTGTVLWRITAGSDTGRGLIGHFNPEAQDAYWQTSANMAEIYDTGQNLISNSIKHGGGASLNNRIYWNGDLADDYYDKSVLEYWNVDSKAFWRLQMNGTNYTSGELNNASKYNPCVLGDMLGDWREEIVTWSNTDMDKGKDSDGNVIYTAFRGNFYLIFHATSFTTDYTLPHLMDDLNYRAQVINQNCAYNQPPHLSYDPITRCTITREMNKYEVVEDGQVVEKYWDSFYTTYPVRIPENVTVWAVTDYSKDGTNTLKLKKITGKAIPANCGVIVKSDDSTASWRPTTISTASVSNTYLKGAYGDSKLECNTEKNEMFYEFRDGDRGLGFYKADGKSVAGGTAFLCIQGTAGTELSDSYTFGAVAPSPVGIEDVQTEQTKKDAEIFTLHGVKVNEATAPGVYIKNGKKIYVK